MTKNEIIQAIAYSHIPSGTQLIEQSDPTSGFSISVFNETNSGGLKIMAARMFADQLTEDTSNLPEVPGTALFERLHTVATEFHQVQIAGCMFDAVEADIIAEHRKMVAKLREIAGKLKVSYSEPDDPLLK